MKKNILFIAIQMVLLAGLGCAAKTSNSSGTSSSGYYLSNGVCYSSSTGVATSSGYCTSSTTYNTSLFSWNGTTCTSLTLGTTVNTAYCKSNPFSYNTSGQCVDSLTAQVVASTYCTGSTTTVGTTNGQCYGTYAYNIYGYVQYMTCAGSNCSGYRLYSMATQQIVTCL